MSNKIPCGGFYLDDTLNVNESGELSIKGGTPYQQLVTDGNGNTQWEDRLAYVTTEEQVIFSQENIAFTERNGVYASDSMPITAISSGEKVRVDFDGETYDCVAYVFDADSGSYVAPGQGSNHILIGNGLLYGPSEDTGEPFLIAYSRSNSEIVIVTLLTNPTHTVSVTRVVETVHKIPEKFLSKGLIVNVVGTEENGGNTYLLFDKTDDEINNAFANGSTVILNYHGFNLQYIGHPFRTFWGVLPYNMGPNGITELVAVYVGKLSTGWLLKETHITASTGAPSPS